MFFPRKPPRLLRNIVANCDFREESKSNDDLFILEEKYPCVQYWKIVVDHNSVDHTYNCLSAKRRIIKPY